MISYEMIDPASKISFMGEVGPYQLLIILAVVLLLFGGKKIPELMKGLGTGIKGFKDGMKGEEENPKPGPPADKE
jgi:sec-independent protein translocase protein TatA